MPFVEFVVGLSGGKHKVSRGLPRLEVDLDAVCFFVGGLSVADRYFLLRKHLVLPAFDLVFALFDFGEHFGHLRFV